MWAYKIGIDGSLLSPGISIKHRSCQSTILIGFTRAKRLAAEFSKANVSHCMCTQNEETKQWLSKFVQIKDVCKVIHKYLFPQRTLLARIVPLADTEDMSYDERLEKLTASIMRQLRIFIPCSHPLPNVVAKFEAVPFAMEATTSLSQLRDFSAILRNKILCQWKAEIIEVSPSKVKKLWTGKGNADKPEMYLAFRKYWQRRHFPCPQQVACAYFGFDSDYDESTFKAHKKPLQDMVDAQAIGEEGNDHAVVAENQPRDLRKRKRLQLTEEVTVPDKKSKRQ